MLKKRYEYSIIVLYQSFVLISNIVRTCKSRNHTHFYRVKNVRKYLNICFANVRFEVKLQATRRADGSNTVFATDGSYLKYVNTD